MLEIYVILFQPKTFTLEFLHSYLSRALVNFRNNYFNPIATNVPLTEKTGS